MIPRRFGLRWQHKIVSFKRVFIGFSLFGTLVLSSPVAAQSEQNLLKDGGFETNGLSSPVSWLPVPGDFSAGFDPASYRGESSYKLVRDSASASRFAAVAQALDAVPLRGKTVRFRAFARANDAVPGSSAGLWLRVDRDGGGRGFFDNMSDRPIRSSEWAEYEIIAPVAEDATRLTVGFLLNGPGPGWIDEASLEVVPTEEADEDDGAPLSDRQVEHLSAFAKLYGYMRWFSPYSEPNASIWAEIAREGAIDAENAASSEALAAVLRTRFEPFAPGLVIRQGIGGAEPESDVSDATDLVRWQHEGVAFSVPAYRSQRVSAARKETWTAYLGAGLVLSLPMAAPRSALPVSGPGEVPPVGPGILNDRATRLGAIIIAWNVFRHFYPYFDDEGEAWASTLASHLAHAATAQTPDDFRQRLERLVADLDDGHAEVGPATNDYRLPFLTQWVEDALVVTAASDALPIAIGDVVVAINGQPVADLMEAQTRLVSASTDSHRMMRAAQALANRSNGSPLQLRMQLAEGQQLDVEVTPVASARLGDLAEARPAPITWFPQGTWYFDLTRLDNARLTAALANVKPDQPVIFDLRGYPQGVKADFLGHLTDEPVSTPPFQIAVDQLPEGRARTWKSVGWSVEPASPRLRARVAFLTDERAVSYSETLLAIVKGYDLADIVGEPTAGMNGNINPFGLPGNHRIVWTGMRVLNHDGSSLFGRGVLPTVPASPTIDGIRSGRDQVLLKGIDVVTRTQ